MAWNSEYQIEFVSARPRSPIEPDSARRPQSARGPTVRDRHIAQIRSNGRKAWQVATRYNRRSRIADRPLEERHRPQAQIPQLLQPNPGDPGRPESSEHNDRTRTACVRTHHLTLRPGERGNSISAPIHATTLFECILHLTCLGWQSFCRSGVAGPEGSQKSEPC